MEHPYTFTPITKHKQKLISIWDHPDRQYNQSVDCSQSIHEVDTLTEVSIKVHPDSLHPGTLQHRQCQLTPILNNRTQFSIVAIAFSIQFIEICVTSQLTPIHTSATSQYMPARTVYW